MITQSVRLARTTNLFWLWWMLAAVAGFAGGMAMKMLIDLAAALGGWTAVLEAIPPTLFGTLLGAMLGLCTGLAQWLVLRRKLWSVGTWVPATLAALTLFWTLHNAAVFGFAHTPWGLVGQGFGHGAIVGGMLGLAQWPILRRRVRHAGWWVLISSVSWSLAGALMHWLLDVAFAAANIHGPFDILLSSTIAGLLSGLGLQRLLEERM